MENNQATRLRVENQDLMEQLYLLRADSNLMMVLRLLQIRHQKILVDLAECSKEQFEGLQGQIKTLKSLIDIFINPPATINKKVE